MKEEMRLAAVCLDGSPKRMQSFGNSPKRRNECSMTSKISMWVVGEIVLSVGTAFPKNRMYFYEGVLPNFAEVLPNFC